MNNQECGSVTYTEGVSVYSVDCGGVQGSVIKITQENNYLTLCEVQVLGEIHSYTFCNIILRWFEKFSR